MSKYKIKFILLTIFISLATIVGISLLSTIFPTPWSTLFTVIFCFPIGVITNNTIDRIISSEDK